MVEEATAVEEEPAAADEEPPTDDAPWDEPACDDPPWDEPPWEEAVCEDALKALEVDTPADDPVPCELPPPLLLDDDDVSVPAVVQASRDSSGRAQKRSVCTVITFQEFQRCGNGTAV